MRRILLVSVLCFGFLLPVAHVVVPAPIVRAADEKETKVYLAKTGGKYHKETCRYVKGKNNTTAVTVSEARQKGKLPCKVCKPPEK